MANPCLALMDFNNFTDTSSLKLNGSAATVTTTDGVVLRLTPANGSQAGSVFSQVPLNAANFSSFLKFRITESGGMGDGGADGIVFVIQPISSDLGSAGGQIGYGGIESSVGVEFDTWDNGEISASHIAINLNGHVNHEGGVVNTIPKLDDGNIWFSWIDYDGATLEVRANQTGVRPSEATLSQKLDIPAILGGVTQAFVGFTSGTGGAFSNHDILSWEYRESFNPITSSMPITPPLPSTFEVYSESKTVELCTAIDASGSISTTDFQLQLNGLANAIEDLGVIPPNRSITLSVVQFSSNATIDEGYGISPVVIDSQTTAQTVANQIRAFKKFEGGTSIQAGIELCAKQFTFKADKQVIDISTDGQAAVSEEFLETLMANGVDAIHAIGVGSGIDKTNLEEIIRPQLPCTECGFLLLVNNFKNYQQAIKAKMIAEITGTTPMMSFDCPPSGDWMDWVCNAGGATVINLNVQANTTDKWINVGNLSNAVVEGILQNEGWVSNLTIKPGAQVTGGTVTGYIGNEGYMADFVFRGRSIKGGILGGTIVNISRVGGYFQDVQLAANTSIYGGLLAGNIQGDCKAPARLESLTVKQGSHLSCVILGDKVKLEEGVTVDSSGQMPTELPALGAVAISATGEMAVTATSLSGGISIDKGEFQTEATVKQLTDSIDIHGRITVDPLQVGKLADIVVYATYQDSEDDQPTYLMFDSKRNLLPWDQTPATLVPLENGVELSFTQPVVLYQGVFFSGIFKITFGYRLQEDGMLVHSEQPVTVVVIK